MKNRQPAFLSSHPGYVLYTVLYDFVSFVFFLLFLFLCVLIGKPLYFLDRRFNTSYVDRLIRFFEFFAK